MHDDEEVRAPCRGALLRLTFQQLTRRTLVTTRPHRHVRYFRVRSAVKRFVVLKVLRHKQVHIRRFRTFLFDQYSIHMLSHVANFTSLIAWVAMLVWTRVFYNAPVYPFNRDLVPARTFWLFIQCVPRTPSHHRPTPVAAPATWLCRPVRRH